MTQRARDAARPRPAVRGRPVGGGGRAGLRDGRGAQGGVPGDAAACEPSARPGGRWRCCSRSRRCGLASRSRRAWPSSAVSPSTCPRTPSWALARAVRDVARNLERFVDGIVARTGPHAVVVELAAQASIPVINGLTLREHPVSGAGRHLHDPGASRAPGRGRHHVRRGRQQRLPLAGAARRGVRDGGAARPSRRLRPQRADRRAGAGAGRGVGRTARVRERPARNGAGRRRRLHRRVDLDGPGSRGGGAARRLRARTGSTTR